MSATFSTESLAQREKTQFPPLRARSQLSASKSEGSGHHGIRHWKQEPGWGSLEMLLAAASTSQVVFLQLHGLKVQGAGGKTVLRVADPLLPSGAGLPPRCPPPMVQQSPRRMNRESARDQNSPFSPEHGDTAPVPEHPSGQRQANCSSESALGHFLEMASLVSLV